MVRVAILCEHGKLNRHPIKCSTECVERGDHDWDGWCEAGRVLDPGSYVLIEKVDGRWPREAKQVLWKYAQEQIVYAGDALDALAGGEQP